MSRPLRGLLLGSIAIAFLYLLWHAREPLRFNIGDPWSDANVLSSIKYVKQYGFAATSFTDILDVGPLTADSYRYIHYPPLSEIIYGAVGKYLGVSDIGTFRLFGLTFSGLAMWLLFSYVRRLYTDRIALIATALFTTSLLWMMYADSMHQAPVMQCTGFLALWGLVRAIETKQKRHYAVAIGGSMACFFTSYDYYVFLPAAVLATVYLKAGNPFAKGNRHFVALCALGCVLGITLKCLTVIGAVGWDEFVADLHLQFLERATSTHDSKFTTSAFPTMFRRITLVLTPFAWIATGYHVVKALRAPSLSAALKDTALWMLLAAVLFLYVFAQLAASQMLASQVLLPFYAIGSALVVDQLLEAGGARRQFAFVWLVAAPLWSFYFMFTHPRSMLDRDDVAKANAYLAERDHNDFLMSNIMSDGHIQATFEHHSWAALDAEETSGSLAAMVRVFELTGTDTVHAIISTDPNTRFIDKSLWPLAMPRRLWSVTGWPNLARRKTREVIAEYDKRVVKNLEAVHAVRAVELENFSVHRIERTAVIAALAAKVPSGRRIDFGNLASERSVMLGWGRAELFGEQAIPVRRLEGFFRCPLPRTEPHGNTCKTILTKYGMKLKHEQQNQIGQILIRIEEPCDHELRFEFAAQSYVRLSVRGFSTIAPRGRSATFRVPASALTKGVNVVELENLIPLAFRTYVPVATLDLTPVCAVP